MGRGRRICSTLLLIMYIDDGVVRVLSAYCRLPEARLLNNRISRMTDSIVFIDPCTSYRQLSDSDRRTSHVLSGSPKCDNSLPVPVGWYRFTGGAGTQMATSCPRRNRCQTRATGWMQGDLPSTPGTVYNRTVCFSWSLFGRKRGCCISKLNIKVKRCSGGFYVYELPRTNCDWRYCGQ